MAHVKIVILLALNVVELLVITVLNAILDIFWIILKIHAIYVHLSVKLVKVMLIIALRVILLLIIVV